MNQALEALAPERQQVVRSKVRQLLERTASFRNMPNEERRQLANSLVNVIAYLSDPNAGQQDAASPGDTMVPLAIAQARGQRQGGGATDFDGAATRQATEVYEELVDAVDFPEFVADLIDGVFNSIVDASIRQMDAYAKLLESVVKSVNEFATDNFTLNQGRDWLSDRFPRHFTTNVETGTPRLELTEEAEEIGLGEVQQSLGMSEEIDLDSEEGEVALAQRGQLEMARLRQKQLATMVAMGINRVVVTDGLINAKVRIDVSATDRAARQKRASSYDATQKTGYSRKGGGWFSSDSSGSTTKSRTLIRSSQVDDNESTIDAKAKLTGEVRVNFKNDYMPLTNIATQNQVDAINQLKAQGGG